MSIQISKEAYEKLIDEDISWLVANSDESLERDHIIVVLRDSVSAHYPEKQKAFDVMAYMTGYSKGAGYPEFNIKKLVTDTPYDAKKATLLDLGIWPVVYPSVSCLSGKTGWSYDIYFKYDKEWSDISRNGIYSGCHMLPFYETKEEAEKAAMGDVDTFSARRNFGNPEYRFYAEHIGYVYAHRKEIGDDWEILGAEIPAFNYAALGDLIDAWEKPNSRLVHTCPECSGKSITIFLTGNPLSGSKSMTDLCVDENTRFSTTNEPGGYMSYMHEITKGHEKSGMKFKAAYEALYEKVNGHN